MFNTQIRNVMFDLAANREIYDDAQGRVISKAEANEAIKRVVFEDLGLTAKSTDKEIRRAFAKDSAIAFFETIEEIIDTKIAYGLDENSFFNTLVETKNLKDGDANEFWAEDDILLNVSRAAGNHHDNLIQTLGSGTAYSIPTYYYTVKVGNDIKLFLTGRKDWSAFVDAVSKAFITKFQTEFASQLVNGVNMVAAPSVLTGTGALSSATKSKLDEIIEKIEYANEAPVAIYGTKTALKNLNALASASSVEWVAESQKEAVATTGIMGSYEGTTLIAIPQKFTDKTLATPIVPSNKLFIMPLVDDNKPIKFVDYGESEFTQTEVGDTKDDMQTYEIQRRAGVGTIMTRYHGVWTI